MSLLPRFDADLKTALKSSDKLTLSVLRLLKAAVKNRQIDAGRELSDDEITAVIVSLAKQRQESIEQYTHAGRDDLAEQERRELSVLRSYLPAQLSVEEIDGMIREAIHETAAKGEADMGKVMRVLMPRIRGVADGRAVNSRVKELLQSS